MQNSLRQRLAAVRPFHGSADLLHFFGETNTHQLITFFFLVDHDATPSVATFRSGVDG
jgi:hypothetical protein